MHFELRFLSSHSRLQDSCLAGHENNENTSTKLRILTENRSIHLLLQWSHRYRNNDLVLRDIKLAAKEDRGGEKITLGGNCNTSLLIRRKKYGLSLLCNCFTSSSSRTSCSFSRPSKSLHSLGSRKFIKLNNSRILLFNGV